MEPQQPAENPRPETQPQVPNPLAEPLLDSAGKFADDPFWDDMIDSIRRHRLELDAEWETVE